MWHYIMAKTLRTRKIHIGMIYSFLLTLECVVSYNGPMKAVQIHTRCGVLSGSAVFAKTNNVAIWCNKNEAIIAKKKRPSEKPQSRSTGVGMRFKLWQDTMTVTTTDIQTKKDRIGTVIIKNSGAGLIYSNVYIIPITKTCLFKYTENFSTKKLKFSEKKFWYFSYFCSKHRLWVLVRTASTRRF